MFSIKGIEDVDRFKILCVGCNVETQNEYQGFDQFRSTCPSCKQTGTWKFETLQWSGLPKDPI